MFCFVFVTPRCFRKKPLLSLNSLKLIFIYSLESFQETTVAPLALMSSNFNY